MATIEEATTHVTAKMPGREKMEKVGFTDGLGAAGLTMVEERAAA
ncbi:MAG TPA: hypothetical protein VFQ05_10955 [Candidatus Eisenbacteria bacterium]|nr:hypothetical protein [Candidatus Eisenbacteria bacterium]